MAEPNPHRSVGSDGGHCYRLQRAHRISFAPEGLAGVRDCAPIFFPLLVSDSRPRQPARWCHSSGSSEVDDPCAVLDRTVNRPITVLLIGLAHYDSGDALPLASTNSSMLESMPASSMQRGHKPFRGPDPVNGPPHRSHR